MDIGARVELAKRASIVLSARSTEEKNRALEGMAEALNLNRAMILEANSKDVYLAEGLLAKGELTRALLKRLIVTEEKIDSMIAGIRDVVSLEDPVGRTLAAIELDEGLELYQVSAPIGLIGVIFESRPDVIPQIMSLCLKSGNAIVFKGGSEASRTNRALFDVLVKAVGTVETIPTDAFQLMETREEVNAILEQDRHIDLLIPRGSNELVRYIQDHTRIPVLGHASGICHVYVDDDADLKKAWEVSLDSKVQYPAVCNASETMLVSRKIAPRFLPTMAKRLTESGVELRCDPAAMDILKVAEEVDPRYIVPLTEEDWSTEYNDLVLSVGIVDSMAQAIDHINRYGSHHTDAIITEDARKASEFASLVDSSSVMINCSTRFADGYRYGKGAEVGISTNKIHARGPVGMEGLMIYKYVLIGNGQVVSDYAGPGSRGFTHRRLEDRYPL